MLSFFFGRYPDLLHASLWAALALNVGSLLLASFANKVLYCLYAHGYPRLILGIRRCGNSSFSKEFYSELAVVSSTTRYLSSYRNGLSVVEASRLVSSSRGRVWVVGLHYCDIAPFLTTCLQDLLSHSFSKSSLSASVSDGH